MEIQSADHPFDLVERTQYKIQAPSRLPERLFPSVLRPPVIAFHTLIHLAPGSRSSTFITSPFLLFFFQDVPPAQYIMHSCPHLLFSHYTPKASFISYLPNYVPYRACQTAHPRLTTSLSQISYPFYL